VTSVSAEGKSLFVYAKTGRDHLPKSWHLRLVEHDRLLVDRDLRAGTVTAYPRVAAVTDVDRNGVPDWWVKTRDYASHGAPWGGLFLFVGIGESIAPLRYRGATLVIDFGGIARLGDGATCRSGDLLLLRAEATDRQNQTWSTSQRRFSISGSNARLVERTHGMLAIDGYNDPDLDPYYEVECFGTNFGVFAPPS
jgi:hypothetical protein